MNKNRLNKPMNIKFTKQQKVSDTNHVKPKPKKDTLQIIMSFASTYHIERLKNGNIVSYFSN